MKKLKHKSIKLGFLPVWVEMYIGGDLNSAIRHFNKKKIFEIEDPGKYISNGRVYYNEKNQTLFLWLKKRDPSTAAHEAVHVAFFASDICGGLFNYDSQETCCYIVQYIVKEVMDV